ncbi:MAG: cohesin domain-containing protein [Patescibacteria group bacterium]|jgi:hypothetical protein
MENIKEEEKFALLNKRLSYFKLFLAVIGLALVFFSGAKAAGAASLYLSPSSGSYEINKTFSLSVFVSSPDQAMNAASGVISFPADKLEVTSLSKSGSIFSLWVQEPAFSNTTGSVNFEGIVMNPGFSGSGGKIITINFKTKASGQANLIFFSGSILANDGMGSNVLNSLGSAKFSITNPADKEPPPAVKEPAPIQPAATEEEKPAAKESKIPAAPKVFSSTHPDQEKWYANNNPEISWESPAGTNGASIYLSESPTSNLSSVSDGFLNSKSYENIENGIWYFHIKLRNQSGWGETSHFRLQIDTEPPAPFTIEFIDGKESGQPQINIVFNAADALSGIDYYSIECGSKDPLKVYPAEIGANNVYTLRSLPLGEQQIKVTAFDKAGNFTSAEDKFIIKPITAPEIIDYPHQLAVGETLTVVGKTIYLDSDIAIWLQKDKEEPQRYLSRSDESGKFTFNKADLIKGIYHLWAAAVDKEGEHFFATAVNEESGLNNFSEKVTIVVKKSIIAGLGDKLYEAGSWAIKFLTLFIPFIALLILLALLLWYSWHKFSKLKIKAAKEIREVKRTLRKELEKSKKDTQKLIAVLEEIREGRKFIGGREERIIEQCKKDLDKIENYLREETSGTDETLK